MLKKTVLLLYTCLVLLAETAFSQKDTAYVNKLNSRAWKLKFSDLDSAILLSKEALEHIPKIKNEHLHYQWKGKAYVKSFYYLGYFYNQKGNTVLPLDYFKQALNISDSINYSFGKSLVMGGLGEFYADRGNYGKALEYYFEGLRLNEKSNHKEGILVRLSNIGGIYDQQHNYKKAVQYYTQALALAEELKSRKHISILYSNLGIVYYEEHDFKRAIEYYSKALAFDRESGEKKGIAINLSNIASIYKDEKEYDRSLAYSMESLKYSDEVGDPELQGTALGNIGALYSIRKDYAKAESHLLKAIAISKEIESLDMSKEFELELSKLYSAMGKDKQALEHFKNYTFAKDSLFNSENTEKVVRSEMNYDFEKQQTIKQKEHEKEVIALEAENAIQKQLRFFLLIALGLILIILFFMKRAYDGKKRVAGLMAEESQRKETLLQEVHHRINNNLQVISSLLSLQANSVGDERLQGYLEQSQNRIHSLSTLHELLYQNDSTLDINMQDYLNKVLEFHKEVLDSKKPGVTIRTDIAPVHLVTKIAVPLALVVNELATNAIKYAFNEVESGQIIISLSPFKEKDNTWELRVSDTGPGLPQETAVRKESLGLRLVNMMSKQIGGLLSKSNSPGATFALVFSINKPVP